MSVFKAYDVRGVYPSELNEELAYKLGRAIVVFLKSKQLIVGRDVRMSSDSLKRSLVNGIIEQGCDVVDIGLCSTPMLYFAALNCPAVMVTASHLPAEFNGFKICQKGAIALSAESGLKDIEQLFVENKFSECKRKGKISYKSVIDDYINYIAKFGEGIKKIKIVVDSGNGMEALVAGKLLDKFPVNLVPLFFDFDGRYPNRSPNPEFKDSLIVLQKKVKTEKADLGIGFDSDCDRVFFVDEKGERIRADNIILLLASVLAKKGESVVFSSNCSRIVEDELKKMKLNGIKARVGHSLMKKVMRSKKAVVGGEISGHYFFRDFNYADSGDISMLLILKLVSSGKKLSQLVKQFQKYFTSEELNFHVHDKDEMIKNIERTYNSKAVKTEYLDGIYFDLKDVWFIVRKSGTEDLVRVVIEGKNKQIVEKLQKEISCFING